MSAENSHVHEHHWEWSQAPFWVVTGIFFLVPLTFAAYFQYQDPLLAAIFAGLGTPMLLAGIAMWVNEGLTHKPLIADVAGIGLPIFIISEVFIFLSFFATYWMMRLGSDVWPPEGTPEFPVVLPLIMTVVLVSSSVTIHVAEEKYAEDDLSGFRKWLMITMALGVLFVGMTFYEYNHLFHVEFFPDTNAFGTIFYSLTGFHASHVIGGLGIFVCVLIPAFKGLTNKTFVTCASVYWHFVDIVWFFVVSQIYFW